MASSLAQSDLRSLFNSVPDAIFIYEADGTLIDVNERALELFRVSREAALQFSIASITEEILSTENKISPAELMKSVWQEEVVKFEGVARRPQDGSHFDAEVVLRRIMLSGQERMMANVRNISDRKATEAALSTSERRLQQLSSNLPGIIYQCRLDTAGQFSFPYVSAGCEAIYGYTPEQIHADASLLFNSIHPEDIQRFDASVRESTQHLTPWKWEGRMFNKAGEAVWISGISRPEKKADGSIVWDGILLDVNDRKLVEQSLKEYTSRRELVHQLTAQIRNSLDIDTVLQTAIDQTRQLLDVDYCAFAWLNSTVSPVQWTVVAECMLPGIASHLGVFPGDVVGPIERVLLAQNRLVIDEADAHPEPIHRQFMQAIGLRSELAIIAIREDEKIGVIFCGQFRASRSWKKSDISLMQAVGDQLAIATSQAQLYAHSQQQAADLSQALSQIKSTQAQIIQAEKLSSLGRMVAGIAHEINNPVNFIHANLKYSQTYVTDLLEAVAIYRQHCSSLPAQAQAAIEKLELDFLKQDFLRLIESMRVGTKRIQEIVLSLRQFSRLDESESKVTSIQECIESTLAILSHQIRACQSNQAALQVIKDYQPTPDLECYPAQLNQALLSLLVNALDAVDSVPSPQICISTALAQDRVVIAIANNGPPIPSSVQKKMFDPFFTTKPVGKGTGMGLAIAHQIITQNHDGQLTFTTDQQRTEFIIQLPISLRPPQNTPKPKVSENQPNHNSDPIIRSSASSAVN